MLTILWISIWGWDQLPSALAWGDPGSCRHPGAGLQLDGPGWIHCPSGRAGSQLGTSILLQAASHPPGGWTEHLGVEAEGSQSTRAEDKVTRGRLSEGTQRPMGHILFAKENRKSSPESGVGIQTQPIFGRSGYILRRGDLVQPSPPAERLVPLGWHVQHCSHNVLCGQVHCSTRKSPVFLTVQCLSLMSCFFVCTGHSSQHSYSASAFP